ncbi:MAG TPA: MFS transporter [Thermoplasmatales archaeon]|nr:MFS transporter [Thermoplasmatales archaeon]
MEKLSRDIFLLGIISFFADASSEMIFPVLPFFVAVLGGGGLALGIIAGLGDGIASISKIFSGHLSDKVGKRKIFIASGYSLSAVSKLFFPLSFQWWHLVFLRGIERIGKGIRGSPRDALIGDLYKERRGEAYGIHRALDTAGAIAGSLMAFIFFWVFNLEIKIILIIAGIIAFFSIPPIFFVKEKFFKKEEKKEKMCPELKKFVAVVTLFSLGNFSSMFFLWRLAGEEITYESISYVLLIYTFFNIFYAVFSPYFGRLSDKLGRKIVIFFGYITFTFVCIGFIFLPNFSSYLFFIISALLFMAYGLTFALLEGTQRALVSDLSTHKGTAQGIFQASVGLATIPANLIAGMLWDLLPILPFIYGAIVSLLSALLISSIEIEKS